MTDPPHIRCQNLEQTITLLHRGISCHGPNRCLELSTITLINDARRIGHQQPRFVNRRPRHQEKMAIRLQILIRRSMWHRLHFQETHGNSKRNKLRRRLDLQRLRGKQIESGILIRTVHECDGIKR